MHNGRTGDRGQWPSITLSVIGHRSKIEKRRGTLRTVTKVGRCGCVSNETNTFHVDLSLSLSLSRLLRTIR